MKSEQEIKDKIAEHQKWIDALFETNDEKDELFWFDLQRLRNGQKALEWVLSEENYIEETKIDLSLQFEATCMYASKIF